MAKRRSQLMGRIIVCLGLVSKIIQLLGTTFGIAPLSGSVMTLITTCLLVGGLSVFAAERMNFTSVFAVISAIATLWGIMALQSRDVVFFSVAVCFLSFGLMLITMKKAFRIFLGILVILLTVVVALHSYFGVINVPPYLMTAIFCSIYAFVGMGIIF